MAISKRKHQHLRLHLLLVCFALWTSGSWGQTTWGLSPKLEGFIKAHPQTTLYLHLDKNNYSPGEHIWFKAYVLSGRVIDNRVLYVRLADRAKHTIRQLQFPMYDIRSNGDLVVPDSLEDGQYFLYAYTDRMLNFDKQDVFVQPIHIRNNARHQLEVEAGVSDSAKLVRGSAVSIVVHAKDNGRPRQGLKGTYTLLDNNEVLRSAKLATNQQGETSINFTYPLLADDHSLRVNISFKDEQDYADLNLNLPHEGAGYLLQACPEGGRLIAGMNNRMVISLTDRQNTPVAGAGVSLEGQAGTVITDANGIALMNIRPDTGTRYQFRITGPNHTPAITLPLKQEICAKGYGLRLATSQAGAVSAMISNAGESGTGQLLIRNADSLVWQQAFTVRPGDSLLVSLPVNTLPKNVYDMALFDEEGKLTADRLFINNRHEDRLVVMKTDAAVYGTRKKVTVQLHITDSQGKPVAANLSMAVVERTAITAKSYPTILSTYYYHLLEGRTASALLAPQSPADIDRLLMTLNWRQMNWPAVLREAPAPARLQLIPNSGGLNGYLEALKKSEGDTQELLLFSRGGISSVPVDAHLHFSIDPSLLLSPPGAPTRMVQSDDFRKHYRVHFLLPEEQFDKALTDSLASLPRSFNTIAAFKPELPGLANVTNLAEVKIEAPVNRFQKDAKGVWHYYSKECTDRICLFGIINCITPGHMTDEYSQVMIPGQKYFSLGRGWFVYHSNCTVAQNPDNFPIKNITKPSSFYAPDFEKIPMDDVPEGTTIYWNPNVGTLNNGVNTLSFFTSDLRGKFTIMVQGIDVHTLKPVYGMTEFEVK